MTERTGARAAARTLELGRSALEWDGTTLSIHIDERAAPVPRALRGTVRVCPESLTGFSAAIDANGRHRWRPMAPRAHVEARFSHPSLAWSGVGYLDSNDGDEPLEAGFTRWHWSRAVLPGAETALLYHTEPRGAAARGLALRVAPDGAVRDVAHPPIVRLPRSLWRIDRVTRADQARVLRTVVDAPFYARSTLATRLFGTDAEAMHETVDLDRFTAVPTQLMLPFRMPRASASASRRANSSSTQPIRSSIRPSTD